MDAAGAITLHCGRWHEGGFRASFELAEPTRNANSTVRRLVRIVQRVPEKPRRLWDRATRRDFSIGVQAGSRPRAFELRLASRTLQAVLGVRAELSVTVYAYEPGAA